jgi:hypothetical protein
MRFAISIFLILLAVFMIAMMPVVKADEREWRDFGIFWIVVLAVIGAEHMIRVTWEILER